MNLATRFSYGRVNSTADNRLSGDFNRTLGEDELRSYVPSIFAEVAHESRSARYAFIPTIDVVRGLTNQGFSPVFACEAKARDVSKIGHTKHMVRFRNHDLGAVNGAVPELVMVNSHDGSTRYQFLAGVFRFICANGAIVGDGFCEVSVRHSGNVVDEAIEGAFKVAHDFERVRSSVDQMASICVNREQQHVFADAALALKYFDEEKGETVAPIIAQQLLLPRRVEDDKNDLWTTYNKVQENMIRGGLRGRTIDAQGRRKRTTTRAVNGIDGNVKLNRALWTLTEKMAQLAA